MNRRFLAPAVLALTLAAGVPASGQAKQRAARISPEALLAAAVPWPAVQAVAGKSYWPELPAFDSVVDQEDPQPLTAVAQTYEGPHGSKVTIRLYAYANAELSLEYLQSAEIVVGAIDRSTPAVGQQHFYFVTTLGDGTPSTRLYFIRGRVGAELEVDGQYWSRGKIAKLGAPLDARIAQLLAGSLRAPALTADAVAQLPAAGDAPGPVLGTASVPAEAWATIVHRGSPRAIRDELVAAGDATLPFRRYLRRGSSSDVIETTVFTFRNAAGARAWFAPFAAGVAHHPADRLAAGNTGPRSAYRLELSNYELQFVAGPYVADVFCYAPFVADPSPSCEQAVRTLAERWYAELG